MLVSVGSVGSHLPMCSAGLSLRYSALSRVFWLPVNCGPITSISMGVSLALFLGLTTIPEQVYEHVDHRVVMTTPVVPAEARRIGVITVVLLALEVLSSQE